MFGRKAATVPTDPGKIRSIYKTERCNAMLVVFTDLDGTFLDSLTYYYDKSLPALEYLHQRNIPVVFCSSKTRSEQEVYREKLGIHHPFIVENGGAIYIPNGYFPFDFEFHRVTDEYQIIELGIPYQQVRRVIEQVRAETGVHFKGYGDMTDEEVAELTGLDIKSAHFARAREYDETVNLQVNASDRDKVLALIKRAGLNYIFGSRFCNVMGPHDKGKAVRILIDLFKRKEGQVTSAGIGDSLNDVSMLSVVDMAYLVQKPDNSWESMSISNLRRVEGIGPEGWSTAVMEIVEYTV